MKALSIRQPWAWLIVHGYKDIENRSWITKFRGEFVVHASQKFDMAGYEKVRRMRPRIPMPKPEEFPRGCLVGYATLVDCVLTHKSKWKDPDSVGFVLTNPKLPAEDSIMVYVKGKLGFFDCDLLPYTEEGHTVTFQYEQFGKMEKKEKA